MRIGIFLDEWRDGGVPVFIGRLEQFLTGRGHEVFLFLANPYPKREKISKELHANIKARMGSRCISLDCNSFPPTWRAVQFQKAILSRGIACLLINQFDHYIHLLRTLADKVPLISIAHTDSDNYYFEFLRTMEMTRAHVAVSRRILEKTLLLTAPEEAGRIKYIPYGVEENDGPFQPLPTGPLRVVYCARLDPVQKRCQDLLPIWNRFRRQGGKGELVIVGAGKGEAFLRQGLQPEVDAGTVRMLGQVSGAIVLREMARADVILNLSNFEGLPQVVIEGTSRGLYPLLSDIESGHREIVETLGTGTLCHVGDIDGFARELLDLEKKLSAIREQREQIRKTTLRHYSLTESCLRYLEVMQAVGLTAPVRQVIGSPARPFHEWILRAFLLSKYRRHFNS